MGIFKAFKNLIIDTTSNAIANSQKKRNREKAYDETGKDIKKAKKTGKYINPSNQYYKNKRKLDKEVDKNNDQRKSFLKDLFD